MANRFPLIVDKDDQNKLKELPQGDYLDLQGSGIVNAASITTSELIVGGIEYNPFSGSYNDLTNTPDIPATTDDLEEGSNLYFTTQRVSDMIIEGQGINLTYNTETGTLTIDAIGGGGGAITLDGLTDVTLTNPSGGQTLKYDSQNQRFINGYVDYDEVQGKPTLASVATSGSYTDLTNKPTLVVDIDDLADVDTTTSPPSAGQVLKWDGAKWAPANDITEGGLGLDADTLDGQDSSYYLNYNNLNNLPSLFSGDWNDLLNTPSTLSGYGITDALSNIGNVIIDGTLTVNDNSLIIGSSLDASILVTQSEVILRSNLSNKDFNIDVRDSNGVNTAIAIDAEQSRVGIFNSSPQYTLDVNGDISASTVVASTLQGNGANITGITLDQVLTGGSSSSQGFSAGTITPAGDSTHDLGTNTIRYANVYADTLHGDYDYNNLSNTPTFATVATSGAYSDLSGAPTVPATITDLGISDGTIGQVLTTNGAGVFTFQDPGDTIGNFTLSASNIDTDDSSAISITPAVSMQSDLTVENDLTVNNNVTINGTLNISTFSSTDTGTPTLSSDSTIVLDAQDDIQANAPFRLVNLTSTERDDLTASNGHMIYNTTTNKVQAYANGAWVDLH